MQIVFWLTGRANPKFNFGHTNFWAHKLFRCPLGSKSAPVWVRKKFVCPGPGPAHVGKLYCFLGTQTFSVPPGVERRPQWATDNPLIEHRKTLRALRRPPSPRPSPPHRTHGPIKETLSFWGTQTFSVPPGVETGRGKGEICAPQRAWVQRGSQYYFGGTHSF